MQKLKGNSKFCWLFRNLRNLIFASISFQATYLVGVIVRPLDGAASVAVALKRAGVTSTKRYVCPRWTYEMIGEFRMPSCQTVQVGSYVATASEASVVVEGKALKVVQE